MPKRVDKGAASVKQLKILYTRTRIRSSDLVNIQSETVRLPLRHAGLLVDGIYYFHILT